MKKRKDPEIKVHGCNSKTRSRSLIWER